MLRKLSFSTLTFSLLITSSIQAQAIETLAKQAIIMDDATGSILYEKEAYTPMHPSSMSKLMTLYILFDQLKQGKLKLTDSFNVSEEAWRKQGSKMFVHVGSQVQIQDLIRGIIVLSGNDACIVVAEGISGTEASFANLMNKYAKRLGLKNSHFTNSTGWPDPNHYMTAYDLALLAKHLVSDFPDFYKYFDEREFTFSNIHQMNRNLLLYRNIGVDGLKTGHTEDGGYGITASGKKGSQRMIVVVNGLQNDKQRADEAQSLLSYGFLNFETKTLFKKNTPIANAEVWEGKATQVPLVAQKDIAFIIPTGNTHDIKSEIKYSSPIKAPIKQGTTLAHLNVTLPQGRQVAVPLVAAKDVEQLSWFGRVVFNLRHYIGI